MEDFELRMLHNHETEISIIKERHRSCDEKWDKIISGLEQIYNEVINIKLERAKENGFRTALIGAGGGGVVVALAVAAYEVAKRFLPSLMGG